MILVKSSVILQPCYSRFGKHCTPLLIFQREGHLLNPQKSTKRKRMMKRRMEKKNRNRNLNQESIKMYHPHLVLWIKWKKMARLAERIIARLEDSDSNEDEDNSRMKLKKVIPQNPPVVILTDKLGIKTCQGCGKGLTKDQQMYPSNMVLR